jgi:hypothetical protein
MKNHALKRELNDNFVFILKPRHPKRSRKVSPTGDIVDVIKIMRFSGLSHSYFLRRRVMWKRESLGAQRWNGLIKQYVLTTIYEEIKSNTSVAVNEKSFNVILNFTCE